MSYKGAIPKGTRVAAELALGAGARGTALVAVTYANNSRGGGSRALPIPPGTTDHCEIPTSPNAKGMIRVLADLNDEADPATLTVYVDGTAVDTAQLSGDTTWVYAVS